MDKRRGFTLLELAIVLVIIGILTGAIFVGQSVMRSTKLNSVLSDASRYTGAITEFRDKYTSLPGDMPNAEAFWGTVSGGCPNGSGEVGQVCNGNGDGAVCNVNDTISNVELRTQWIMLANAGFISGSFRYSGISSASIGGNLPTSAVGNGSFQFYYATCLLGSGLYSNVWPYANHWLAFGGVMGNGGVLLPIVSGQEGYGIDKKMDDGMPGTGSVRGSRNGTVYSVTPNCQTTNDPNTALYNQIDDNPNCFLMFQYTQ
ncbi:MAG: prepilin-type N-terminal cleavage/methylation domain-containing protein [Rickettsiales bacterium]|nr:prepilin-type N-terminal cleavage/methylation domain-containing protein [Rickettsiales bacterium]